ncbi:14976_t:CDS:2 [Acaulospora colombiana]|uniref:14976_t:CDS:1 n=1 Tax=Acaulospora colombiana TaxID=27376 RepID=A0ACA9KCD0_9GLOM|nr:14976_t:CDS:2 [Acaulospora colombiana]
MKSIYDKLEPDELEELEKLNPMQKFEEAQRLVRARERLRKSTQEDKKRRKVKLINHLNLPPVRRNYGGWVKQTPLQKVLRKTLRSGAYEHRTHFTQLESGPTMMTVPADWLQGSRDSNLRSMSSLATGGPSNRIPAQVELPFKYLPTNTKSCSERRVDTKISSANNGEFDRNCQQQSPFGRSAALARSNMSLTPASKRVHEAETMVSVTKRARAESSTNVYSTRVNNASARSSTRQLNVTHSSSQRVVNSISRPQKVSDSSFSRDQPISKQPRTSVLEKASAHSRTNKSTTISSRSNVSTSKNVKSTSDSSRRLELNTISKYDNNTKIIRSSSTASSAPAKLVKTAAIGSGGKVLR